MTEITADYRGHPPGMWKDVSKIDLWKTAKRMMDMRKDFKGFTSAVPVGTQAPDFELEDATGVKHALADFRNKIVVLEFGAIT